MVKPGDETNSAKIIKANIYRNWKYLAIFHFKGFIETADTTKTEGPDNNEYNCIYLYNV